MVCHTPHQTASETAARLNLLLSDTDWREQCFADQLPRLLTPMGVATFRVNSGREAEELIREIVVHIAVVDLRLPLRPQAHQAAVARPTGAGGDRDGGIRILQLLRRLEAPPPTVVVRSPADRTLANQRTLRDALREGAFAVIDSPVQLEVLLETLRRILRRHYADAWPDGTSGSDRTAPRSGDGPRGPRSS